MKNEDELLESVTIKSDGWSRPNRSYTAQEYFLNCNDKFKSKDRVGVNGYNGMKKVIVGEDNISFLNGHKFKFKPMSDFNNVFKEYDCYYLLTIQEGSKPVRIFLVKYPVYSAGFLKEITITHFIKPKLGKLDFLRKAFKEDESVGNELIKLLTEKAKYKLSKIIVNFEPAKEKILDVTTEDANKGLTIKQVTANYNVETAMDYCSWLKRALDITVFGINYNDNLTNKEKAESLEGYIKSINKFRREVKYLKNKIKES